MSRKGYVPHFPFCDVFDKYDIMAKVGQGTYGEVFKARLKGDSKLVALKRVMTENENEGFPTTALREIRILQLLKHKNVVNYIELCRTEFSWHKRMSFYLVFDFCEHDLAGLLANVNVKFTLAEIKNIMQQLFNGLYYTHASKILHRDIKTANILITKEGVLKLADFGLSRPVSSTASDNCHTSSVVTLWYRSPELLLGDRNYGPGIDMWGAGCVMAQMWTRLPIMQGYTEQQQLNLCTQLCGSFTPEVWPEIESLELYNKIELPANKKRRVKELLSPLIKDKHAIDLVDQLLILDPAKRIDADQALNHDFFWENPRPSKNLDRMLSQLTQSNFDYIASPPNSQSKECKNGLKDHIY